MAVGEALMHELLAYGIQNLPRRGACGGKEILVCLFATRWIPGLFRMLEVLHGWR